MPLLLLSVPAAVAAPNVLVVIADDMGVDKAGAWAGDVADYEGTSDTIPLTPTIDGLAASGLRFTDAWSNPTCSPTRASLLTGRHAFRTGMGETADRIGDLDLTDLTLLPAVLSDAADGEPYATGLFGKWHLGTTGDPTDASWELTAADAGFRAQDATPHPLLAGFGAFRGPLDGILPTYWAWERVWADGPGYAEIEAMTTYATDQTVADTLDWIDAQSGPWFAVASFNAPHTTDATDGYDAADVEPGCHAVTCLDDGTCTTETRYVYRALVECLDTDIAALLDGIAPKVLDDTLVVFLGDNGTPRGLEVGPYADTGDRIRNGKGSVYESGVRVPVAITWGDDWRAWQACTEAERADGTCVLPGTRTVSPGRVVTSPVHTLDLYATLAEAAGHDGAEGTDSVSFAACFVDPSPDCAPARPLYTEVFELDDDGATLAGSAAIRDGDWKLTGRWNASSACLMTELYDLASDRFERTNLAESEPAVVAALQAELLATGATWFGAADACVVGGPDDRDYDGYFSLLSGGDDCNDRDPTTNPGAIERWYDGQDRNCDGADDYDQDFDGYRSVDHGGDDCADEDDTVHPGADEVWYDGVDQDCDDNDSDQDHDGFEAAEVGGDDCDDTDPLVSPGARERWYDGIDQDCDGNDGDRDGDGYLATAVGGTDCDDRNASIHPDRAERWYDGVDQNCDGADDYDRDHDGYRSDAYGGDDCDDTSAAVHPGALEKRGDAVDSDCDGAIDT